MTDYRTIADTTTHPDLTSAHAEPGDRLVHDVIDGDRWALVRIERPRSTTEALQDDEWDGNWRTISQDEQTARRKLATWTKADLIDRHIGDWQRDLQFRESAQEQLDEWVTRARAAEAFQPSPLPPTRERIAEARQVLYDYADRKIGTDATLIALRALIQNGADR